MNHKPKALYPKASALNCLLFGRSPGLRPVIFLPIRQKRTVDFEVLITGIPKTWDKAYSCGNSSGLDRLLTNGT